MDNVVRPDHGKRMSAAEEIASACASANSSRPVSMVFAQEWDRSSVASDDRDVIVPGIDAGMARLDVSQAAGTPAGSEASPVERLKKRPNPSGSAPARPASFCMTSKGPSIREVMASVAENDSSLTEIVFSNSAVFQSKPEEFCQLLADALRTNTTVTSVVLAKCGITDKGAAAISGALEGNKFITDLNLAENSIGSEGAQAIAKALQKNDTLLHLTLLNQKHSFGDECLQAFLDMFEHNIVINKTTWRLDSRKSFAINNCIVRNNDILRRKQQNRDYTELLPGSMR